MTTPIVRLIRYARRLPAFGDRTNAFATIALTAALAYPACGFIRWAIVDAVWTIPPGADAAACRAAAGRGACWAVIGERARFVLLGPYPFGEQWRAVLAGGLFAALFGATAFRMAWRRWLTAAWIVVPAAAVLLLNGGVAGLPVVPTEFWGGLPLTFLVSTVGFVAAVPAAVALALARRSTLPALSTLAVSVIELVRGVPIITTLFMATVMFPLFVPDGVTIDKMLRAQIAYSAVIAAYLAEVIRAGLQGVPAGQREAAASLGLGYWRSTAYVVLPQALRLTVPALVNTYIAFFKDTSLLAVIGLFDLLGAAKAVNADGKWAGFSVEVYLFAGAIYFAFSHGVSRYSQRLERALARSRR